MKLIASFALLLFSDLVQSSKSYDTSSIVRFLFEDEILNIDSSSSSTTTKKEQIRLRKGKIEIVKPLDIDGSFASFYDLENQFHSSFICNKNDNVCFAEIPYEKMEIISNYQEDNLILDISITHVIGDSVVGEAFPFLRGKVYYFEDVSISSLKEPTRIDSFLVKKKSYRPDYRIPSLDARSKVIFSLLSSFISIIPPLILLLRLLPSLSPLMVSIPLMKESKEAFIWQIGMISYLGILVWNSISGNTALTLAITAIASMLTFIFFKKKK